MSGETGGENFTMTPSESDRGDIADAKGACTLDLRQDGFYGGQPRPGRVIMALLAPGEAGLALETL